MIVTTGKDALITGKEKKNTTRAPATLILP